MKPLTALKLAAVVGVFAYAAARADVPVSVGEWDDAPYPTADAAAIAALEASARLSRTLEYAGAVYYTDGSYRFTAPVTSGNPRDVDGYRIRITRRGTVVALYHTHPRDMTDDVSEWFSPADVATSKALHLTSYVGVLKSARVIAFDPKHDKTRNAQGAAYVTGGRIADGHAVGALAVVALD